MSVHHVIDIIYKDMLATPIYGKPVVEAEIFLTLAMT